MKTLSLLAARNRRRNAAFSLLEVMVAVAILGLALSIILSAQGGLAASNKRAENMGQAANYARCKITEQEEKLLKLGYPTLDAIDQDQPCCNDDSGKFRCDTRLEKVILPIPPQNSMEGGAALALGSAQNVSGVASTAPGGILNNPLGNGGSLNFDGGLGGLGSQLTQVTGGQGAAEWTTKLSDEISYRRRTPSGSRSSLTNIVGTMNTEPMR